MPTEQIVLEIEERPAVEAARRANRELEKYEQSVVRAAQSASRCGSEKSHPSQRAVGRRPWAGEGPLGIPWSGRHRGGFVRQPALGGLAAAPVLGSHW
jgi:hypothetical protein